MNQDDLFNSEAFDAESLSAFNAFAKGYGILLDHQLSGSRVICDPPVLDTDEDHLYLVSDLDHAGQWFGAMGWDNCLADWIDKQERDPGSRDATGYAVELESGARFQAWRRGEVNVIITDDETLHLRSVAATLLATRLNLRAKEERIKLFRCIKFGEVYGGRYE